MTYHPFLLSESFRRQSYQPPILSAFTIVRSNDHRDLIEDDIPVRNVVKSYTKTVKNETDSKVWITMGKKPRIITLYRTLFEMQAYAGVKMLTCMARTISPTLRQLSALSNCGTR